MISVQSTFQHMRERQACEQEAIRRALLAERDARAVYLDYCASLARSSCELLGVPSIKRPA